MTARMNGPLRVLLRDAQRASRRMLLTQGTHMPIVVAVPRRGPRLCLALHDLGDTDRDRVVGGLRTLFLAYDVRRFCIAFEAWTLAVDPGETSIRPSQSERREEVVIVSVADDNQTWVSVAQIERNADGGVGLQPWSPPTDYTTSWVSCVLPLPPIAEDERARLRAAFEAAGRPMPGRA
jgi:hypothetical protein